MSGNSFTLTPFDTQKSAALGITITGSLTRIHDHIDIHYSVVGDIGNIDLSAVSPKPARKNALWEQTCFEMFIAPGDSPGYWEYNLSPSQDWAVFKFIDYRQSKADDLSISQIGIGTQTNPGHSFSLHSLLPLPGPLLAQPLDIGVCCVIQDLSHEIHYYALSHARHQADFHDRASFILHLDVDT